MKARFALVFVIAACSSKAANPPPAPSPAPAPVRIDAPIAIDAVAVAVGADGVARGALPAQLPPKVAAFLAEPVPDDVVVRFAEISRSDDHALDERWDLDRAGRLFFARGAGAPLPAKPSLKIDEKHMREIYAAFDAQHFADHPGYEGVPGAVGGTTVIVRARRRDQAALHTVVYDVARPDLLDFLDTITVSL